MIERVILALLTHFGSLLITEVMKRRSKKLEEAIPEEVIDEKLNNLKLAYRDALDGTPITPEQKSKLNKAISDFIRSSKSRM